MILDRLEHWQHYRGLSPIVGEALAYLASTELAALPDGRYELDARRLVALVQRYRSKPAEQAVFEAHRDYADVQYIVAGQERIGHALADDRWPVRTPYDSGRDVAFYDAEGSWFDLRAGDFAVFLPQDLHAPGVTPAGEPAADVLKVVVKCLWLGAE